MVTELDMDVWCERAAIMQFDGGLSRYEAEVRAAVRQGKKRWEFINENNKRNSPRGGHNCSQSVGDTAHGLPGMQSHPQEKERQMPCCDIQPRTNPVVLPSLQSQRGKIL